MFAFSFFFSRGRRKEEKTHAFSFSLSPSLSFCRWSNFLASCSTLTPSPASSSSTSFSPTSLLAAAAAKTAASATKGLPRGQAELRAAAALWIAGHPTTFAPFLGDGDPRTVALQYAGRMARDAAWGGQAEQVALCQLLGVRLRVFQAGQQPWIMDPPMSEPEEEGENDKGEGGEGGAGEGWSKPRKTAKKRKKSGDSSAPHRRPSSEIGHAEAAEASPLPVINISYHNGEHYNSVRRQPLDSREAAAAAAARHLRDKEAVAKALAALGEIDGGGGGGKKKKQQQQQQQERDEQKPESPPEEAAEAAISSAAGEEKDEGEAEEGKEQQPAAAAVAAPSADAALQQKKNDPCACGSGLRYKSCCRPRDRARVRAAALAEAAGVDVSELARKLGDGDGDELAARLKELVV